MRSHKLEYDTLRNVSQKIIDGQGDVSPVLFLAHSVRVTGGR